MVQMLHMQFWVQPQDSRISARRPTLQITKELIWQCTEKLKLDSQGQSLSGPNAGLSDWWRHYLLPWVTLASMVQSAVKAELWKLSTSANNPHLSLVCPNCKTPAQKCGIHSFNSAVLSVITYKGTVISRQHDLHQPLLCVFECCISAGCKGPWSEPQALGCTLAEQDLQSRCPLNERLPNWSRVVNVKRLALDSHSWVLFVYRAWQSVTVPTSCNTIIPCLQLRQGRMNKEQRLWQHATTRYMFPRR